MPETPERLAARLERLVLGQQREKRMPSISAAVLRDGELIWEKAVGAANVESDLEATPDTQYRIGSITKTFTATLLAYEDQLGCGTRASSTSRTRSTGMSREPRTRRRSAACSRTPRACSARRTTTPG